MYKKILCVIISLSLVLLLPLKAAAAEISNGSLGYNISLSADPVPVGEFVTAVISIDGYDTSCPADISGIQIDITGIDTDILSVESYAAKIIDSSAFSNKATYFPQSKTLRLLYVSTDGGYLKKPCKDVMEITFKVNESLNNDGSISLPVTVKIAADENITLKSNLIISYTTSSSTASVDIVWGSLSYTYSDGTWNPETHTYDGASWSCDKDANKISVTNNGESGVNIGFGYSVAADFSEISGAFIDLSGSSLTSPIQIAKDETVESLLEIKGAPHTSLSSEVIGTVTVTVGEVN